jgi:flavin-dependent dehydrogenase
MFADSSPSAPVIVVGAGPAGATAALALAKAGIAVRLLDRAAFPRNKPCGGGISARALIRFPYLDRSLSSIATHRVSRLYQEGPDGRSAVIDAGRPAALMVRRVEFDALLVSLAVEAGAELISGADVVQAREDHEQVTLTTRRGQRFTAPVVIAADGVNSVVARRLGLNRGWPASMVALDMMEETPTATTRSERAAPKAMPTCFRNAITSTSASATCCRTFAGQSTGRRTICSSSSSSGLVGAGSWPARRRASISRRR